MRTRRKIKNRDPSTKYHLLLVSLAAGFGVAVALVWFFHDGVNYQEKYNLALSLTHSSSIFHWGSNDDPMPLYYLMLHWFNVVLHVKNLLVWDRLLSLFSYVTLVFVAYMLGRLATGRSYTGLIAALLVATSPFMIWYASRATVYSWLALMVGLNQLAFVGMLKQKRWAPFFYLITCLLGLGLHFFFLAILIPQIFYLIIKLRDLKRVYLVSGLVTLGITIAGFVGWFILSSHATTYWHFLPYTAKPSATNTFIILFQYLFGFQSVVITTLVISLWPILVILALLAVQKYIRPPDGVKYLFISAALPIVLLFLASWVWRPLFLSSYLIVCLPPSLTFLAWYLSAYKMKALVVARYVLIAGMLAMMAMQIINWHLALTQDYLGLIGSHL